MINRTSQKIILLTYLKNLEMQILPKFIHSCCSCQSLNTDWLNVFTDLVLEDTSFFFLFKYEIFICLKFVTVILQAILKKH